MDHKKIVQEVLVQTENMALATSTREQANVRIVTFGYDSAQPNRVYFTSFKENAKVREFAENAKVALLPLTAEGEDMQQVRIFGKVQPAQRDLAQVIALIGAKNPDVAENIQRGGPMIQAFEVQFEEAYVTLGMNPAVPVQI